jgi:hypothetical protein
MASMKVKPCVMSRTQPPRTHCERGHAISGYNAQPQYDSRVGCRACITARLWARRHDLFLDDPRVAEHANQEYERYGDTAATQ